MTTTRPGRCCAWRSFYQTVDTDNASAESGRGIALVCALSNQFVVLRGPGTGKTVQAVLPGC